MMLKFCARNEINRLGNSCSIYLVLGEQSVNLALFFSNRSLGE